MFTVGTIIMQSLNIKECKLLVTYSTNQTPSKEKEPNNKKNICDIQIPQTRYHLRKKCLSLIPPKNEKNMCTK